MTPDDIAAAADLALPLIRAAEGFSATPYRDAVGLTTLGYGRVVRNPLGQPVTLLQARQMFPEPIARSEAESWLHDDIATAAAGVAKLVTVLLQPCQLAALTSFAFNVGVGRFRDSTLLRRLNRGEYQAVPSELARYVYANGQRLEGLAKRRAAEAALWWRDTGAPPSAAT